MSVAHTPGPWNVDSTRNEGDYGDGGPDPRSGFDSFVVVDEQGRSLFDSLNSSAIEVHEEAGEDDLYAFDAVGKANLTLAAAAPELLTALKALRMVAVWDEDADEVGRADFDAAAALADAAINRAEGRS